MADTKITALTAATAPDGTELTNIIQGGNPTKATVQQVRNAIYNQNTTTQLVSAATAYLAGSSIAIPAGKIRLGTRFRWKLQLSKTAAGTAANSFLVKIGTLGTTGDTTLLTFTTPVGTAVVDQGMVEIDLICNGPLSASGIFQGNFFMTHGLATTGLINVQTLFIGSTSGTFDVTTANLIVGLVCTSAVSTALTFQEVAAEAYNL